MKRCSKCGQDKPLGEFWRDRHKPDGLVTCCRHCANTRRREKLKHDPEWAANQRARKQQWKRANPEKVRAMNRHHGQKSQAGKPTGEIRDGHIYFVEAENGLIKIGFTTQPRRRLLMLQAQSPVQIRLLTIVTGTTRDELALHWRFAKHRDHGEWFRPNSELLNLIKSYQESATATHPQKQAAAA